MRKTKNKFADNFQERVREFEKHPDWWIEGIRLHIGEVEANLKMVEKFLKKAMKKK